MVNTITRGGGNAFHGDAFEYVRNRDFDAANYFSYQNGVKTRDFLKRNQFGGTFNGPVRIPWLFNGKDKTFFSFGVQANVDGSGINRDRAIWNGQNPYGGAECAANTHCKHWLNKTNFSTNPSYTTNVALSYGNIAKGSFVGPQFASWDVSVIRSFPIYERFQMEFRAEFCNVLNHTNFGDPQQTQTNSSFGSITSTNGDPRIGQMSLKLAF